MPLRSDPPAGRTQPGAGRPGSVEAGTDGCALEGQDHRPPARRLEGGQVVGDVPEPARDRAPDHGDAVEVAGARSGESGLTALPSLRLEAGSPAPGWPRGEKRLR